MKRTNPFMILAFLLTSAVLLWHSPSSLLAEGVDGITSNPSEGSENNTDVSDPSGNPPDDTEDDTEDPTEPGTEDPGNPDDPFVTINVTAESINSGDNARKTIQTALTKARKNATAEKPYVIKVEAGTYTLPDGILHIYSYTTLDLTGVTLYRAKTTNNIIHVGATNNTNDENGVGYEYKDIKIIGGTFDGSGLKATVIKVGHASNFTMTGCTVQNVNNGHLMEVAGTDGLTITNCVFKDQSLDSGNSAYTYEAIQLDIPYSEHFSNYRSEPLTTKNVNISNCTFSNVPRGIGTHTAIQNLPMENINISNCTFSNIASAAIHGQSWVNCNITNNTISDSPRGIILYSVLNQGQGVYTASTIARDGGLDTTISSAYVQPAADQKIVISNNTITLNDFKDPYVNYSRGAIIVSGSNVTSAVKYADGSGGIATGNYYVSGVTISSNTITTTGHGIRMIDCRNSFVTGNVITGKKSASDSTDYYGIQAREGCSGIAIQSNTIKKAIATGIFIAANSSATTISSNTITSPGKYGIDVEQSTTASIVSNKITSPAKMGIFVYYSSTVDTIKKNTISSSGGSGIYVVYKAKVTTASNNTVKSSKDYGVSVTESSKITTLKNNTLFKSKIKAVYKDNYSSITTDKNNFAFDAPKLSAAKNHKDGVKVTWKKVSNANTYNIYRKIKGGSWQKVGSSSTNSYIDTTAISGTKYYYTVCVTEDSKARSEYNTTGVSCYYLATPVFSSLEGGKKEISLKWKKIPKATGYTIQYSTTKSFKKYKTKKISSAKTLKYTFKKLSNNKTYYVRIRSFRKTGTTTYYSAWSTPEKVKTLKAKKTSE